MLPSLRLVILIGVVALVSVRPTCSQSPGHFVSVGQGLSADQVVSLAATVAPTPHQMRWQRRELVGFIHFGMNTFTGREWGEGTEDPAQFLPTDFDARQWVRVFKAAGLRMLVLTAKHHDGFCLWPTATTHHSVRSSPWRAGQGDVVKEVSQACREEGIDFGVYVSPWDRHEETFGDSPAYNEFFRRQLRELLSGYGPIAEVWFDGASGEGRSGRKQTYDWQSYYRVVRDLQPEAVIFGMGPDVRWVGTETGCGRETEWSVIPDVVRATVVRSSLSLQQIVDGGFVPGNVMCDDVGSREKITKARSLLWYPAEADVSIRPGWFYHKAEDSAVKTPAQLVDIYCASVGRNAVLLVNVPPDRRGKIHEGDIESLLGMREILDSTFCVNHVDGARATASSEEPGHAAAMAVDADDTTFWTPGGNADTGSVVIELPCERSFDCLMVQEFISAGQRVEAFRLDAYKGQGWVQVTRATTIGYKRLLRFPAVTASRVRLVIERARGTPAVSSVGLFTMPSAKSR